jgi:hypothetical protein
MRRGIIWNKEWIRPGGEEAVICIKGKYYYMTSLFSVVYTPSNCVFAR